MFVYEGRILHGGIQRLYRFDNGYGASVIQHKNSYGSDQGLWELALIKFEDYNTYKLVYDTETFCDVIGHLEESEIEPLLVRISNFKQTE